MNEEQFWVAVWKIAASVVAVLIVSVSGCQMHRDRVVANMVKAGSDPIDAACAAGRDMGAVCILRAAR